MKNGFRVYDSDTHVNPAAEVLDKYVDPGFRPRLAELERLRNRPRGGLPHLEVRKDHRVADCHP